MAEQQYDALDHEEGRCSQVGSTLAASGSAGGALLLRRREELTIGASSGKTQTSANSACFVAWALLRSLKRQHSCDQDKQEHITELAENMNQANKFHDSRTVWLALRWGREVSFLLFPDACQLGPLHCHNL